jgi:hypothetical protein
MKEWYSMAIDFITVQKSPLSSRERKLSRVMLFFEDIVKVPLFGCQHCGECILSSTAFICSQQCPKRIRNGPCGGTGAGGSCEVYPDRACVWYRIYYRSKFFHRISLLSHIKRIHNWNLEGTSAWLNVFKKRIEAPIWFVHHERQQGKELNSGDTQRKG